MTMLWLLKCQSQHVPRSAHMFCTLPPLIANIKHEHKGFESDNMYIDITNDQMKKTSPGMNWCVLSESLDLQGVLGGLSDDMQSVFWSRLEAWHGCSANSDYSRLTNDGVDCANYVGHIDEVHRSSQVRLKHNEIFEFLVAVSVEHAPSCLGKRTAAVDNVHLRPCR